MKTKSFFFALLFTLGALTIGCNDSSEREAVETEPVVFKKEGELQLLKPDGKSIKKIDIEIADDSYSRQTGLMYRERGSMLDSQGMLFIYPDEAPRSFYMKNTYIPLDILFFSSDSIAVSFQENTIPEDESSLPSGEPAQYILEINAGLVEKWGVETGDKIEFEKIE